MHVDLNGLWLAQMNQVMHVVNTQQKTIAQNIANCNTPGYVRQQISFQEALTDALHDPSPALAPSADLPVERDQAAASRPDGNNVTMEKEMVDLAQNTQLFTALSRIVSKNIRAARYVISGGRG